MDFEFNPSILVSSVLESSSTFHSLCLSDMDDGSSRRVFLLITDPGFPYGGCFGTQGRFSKLGSLRFMDSACERLAADIWQWHSTCLMLHQSRAFGEGKTWPADASVDTET